MVASELPYRGTSGGVVAGVKEQASTRKAIEGVAKPFILSEGLPPVPAKIVTRILRGEFIDMVELLRDNLEVQRRGALQDAPSSTGVSRSRREVPDLLSWVQCFSIYTAVMASAFPERVHKLLAYQTLIIREARRCGGKGWLAYDSFFRQQMSGEWQGEAWGRLNPYLFSSTFLACGASQRPNCSLCLECDHQEDDCALAKEKGSTVQCTPQLKAHSYWEQMREGVQRGSRGKAPRSTVCFSWNQGDCSFPYCRYRHVCFRCGGDHKILHCRMVGSNERRHPRERDTKQMGDVGQAKSS